MILTTNIIIIGRVSYHQQKDHGTSIAHLCNLDDVNDRHGDVDVDGDVLVVDLVKAKRGNLLVVIVLENTLPEWKFRNIYFINGMLVTNI